MVNFAPRVLYTRENEHTHRTGGWVGPHSQPGRFGEQRKSLALAGIRTPDRPARGIIAIMAPEELRKYLEESHTRQAVS